MPPKSQAKANTSAPSLAPKGKVKSSSVSRVAPKALAVAAVGAASSSTPKTRLSEGKRGSPDAAAAQGPKRKLVIRRSGTASAGNDVAESAALSGAKSGNNDGSGEGGTLGNVATGGEGTQADVDKDVAQPQQALPTPAPKNTMKTKAKSKSDSIPQWKNDAFALGHPSSMTVLLNWLRDGDNYDKWKGGEGDTQNALAADISQLISEAKCKAERSPSSIIERIRVLEKTFRAANDFRLQTGQGLLDKAEATGDDEAVALQARSVENTIVAICQYYYDLAEVMDDRIASNPTLSFSTSSSKDVAGQALRSGLLYDDYDDDEEELGGWKEDDVKEGEGDGNGGGEGDGGAPMPDGEEGG
ncbi:hypothetical protein CF327_g5182 [Tilletia walkeri]|nr:hypothetical protein CF327_g5182 [Tilletia walkeri]